MFDFWKKFGYYNGAKINQSFSKWDFEKEIRTILRTQEKSQEFIDSYIKLFLTNRDFSSGPGGPKSPTKYGLYRLDSNGHIKKIGDNLWTETIGKCTIYKTESRAGKYSPFAEIFNLLSDLNNLYFNFDKNSKLTYNQKRKLFNQVSDAIKKNKTKNISLGMISKICDINKENISGYNREKEITKITNTIEIAKLLFINKLLPKELDLLDINHLKIINDFFEIIRKAPSDLIKQIKLIENSEFSSIDNHQLQELLSKNIKSISETHSLSNKALVEYIQYAINGNDNQRVFFDEHFNNNMNLKNYNILPKPLFSSYHCP